MTHRIVCLAIAAAAALAPLASAQTPPPAPPPPAAQQPPAPPPVYVPTSLAAAPGLPRTPADHPDFQSTVWAVNFLPVFESNAMAPNLVVSEAQAKQMSDMMVQRMLASPDPNTRIDPEIGGIFGNLDGLPIVRGQRRSRLIVLPADGKLPITPEERKAAAAFNPLDGTSEGPETRSIGDRCLVGMGQPPISMTLPFTRLRFIQTREHVVIHTEMADEIRIIPFAATHKPATRWMGDSIARWEGDTLVIETVGLPKEMRIRGFPKIVVGPDATVIERFTRLSKEELLYQWTVVDPKVYTAPWLAEFSFYSSKTGMFPSPCHEGNYSLSNILKARVVADERAARLNPKPKPKQ